MTAAEAGARRVLLVEDEPLIAMTAEDLLGDLGLVVVGPALSVEEALALLQDETRIDIGFLDINLRGQLVFPVADILRARGVPILYASGYGGTRARDADRDCIVLQKPYLAQDLAQAISRTIRL